MTTQLIPGYTYGSDEVAASPVSLAELGELKADVMFGPDDEAALRMAGEVLADQVEDVLDVWYGFVGSHAHLLAYFSGPDGQPIQSYLDRVRARFGRWILDTCQRPFDQAWLDYQHEIALRHTTAKKNSTDGVDAPPVIGLRHLIAFIYPITATMRPFLAARESDPDRVEAMAQAWNKAVMLQVTLWARAYTTEGSW